MTNILRQEIATAATTVVIKVGTNVVTDRGVLDESRIAGLTAQLYELLASGRKVAMVSSGAVAAGMARLGLASRPKEMPMLQAIAAVGQSKLAEAYDRHLQRFNRHAAQVLLTADDLNDRARYLNVRNTLLALLQLGTIPIINENDTVSVDELRTTFGDNDRLAALVTNLLRAPLLILLSDVDGLYDGDPDDDTSRVVSTVTRIDDTVQSYVRDAITGLSKGGMASKLEAARICTTAGENVIIAPGRQANSITDIMAGKPVGTLFLAQGKSISPWKRWIGFSVQPRGQLILDDGASRAIRIEGRSLLAIGILSASGNFQKGDVVALCDQNGKEIARGLTNYVADEIRQIAGMPSARIEATLGYCSYEEVIHRDNIVVTNA